ncbi:MAG: ABC transporter permease [Chloroflexi bacterium]|nr:MAG: ABC transporter permease [Chloroflexota bacterium]
MQISGIKSLFSDHRDLLLAWTARIIRARYQQSVLGGLWAIIQPLSMVIIFTVIFTTFIPIDTGEVPYVIFAYTAMVPWALFAGSLNEMVFSLVGNMNLVSKIYFPREILPIAALLARLLDAMIAFSLLVVIMLFYRMPVFTFSWLFLPVILIVQIVFVLGLGFIGSALNVFYRDITHVVGLGLQVWLYATPIIYPVTAVPERFQTLYFLNPMAGIIESYRAVLLRGEMPSQFLWLSAVVGGILFIAGYWIFKRLEFQFADVV